MPLNNPISNSDMIQELPGAVNRYYTDGRSDARSIAYSEGTVITVKTDGTGNFTNLSAAIASITDSSKSKKYTIKIYEGTYDVFSTLTTAELAGVGIVLPNYVDLKGIGDRDSIILKGELADTATLDESTRLSPLNVKYNNNLFNITVTAKNCRYAIHADNGSTFKNYTQYIENCTFEHFGNVAGLWTACLAWGEGTASGAKEYFKNCKFVASGAFSTHNNLNYDEGDYHEFENCIFIADFAAAKFITLNSYKVCKVLMKGCKFQGNISQNQSDASVTGMEYEIEGYGNEFAPHDFVSAQNIQKYNNFSEEIDIRGNHNAVALLRGRPMRWVGCNKVGTMYAGDTVKQFAGLVAMDCANTDKNVVIKKAGYFPVAYTALTGLGTGSLIGITSGAVAVVTDYYDAFAVAVDANWLKFI